MMQSGSYESFSNELWYASNLVAVMAKNRLHTKLRQKLFLAYPGLYNRKQEGVFLKL